MLQKVLGADHPKGVGSKMSIINNMIKAKGFEPADVYSNERRDPEGKRIWEAGPRGKELLDLLELEEL